MYTRQVKKIPIWLFMDSENLDDLGVMTSTDIERIFNESKMYDKEGLVWHYGERDTENITFVSEPVIDPRFFNQVKQDLPGLESITLAERDIKFGTELDES